MKKIISSILSIALLISALTFNSAQALTISDISMLQAAGIITAQQAASLQASISGSANIQPQSTVATPSTTADVDTSGAPACAIININLRYGMRDSSSNDNGVSVLQDFLSAQGYLNTQSSGFFGSMTSAAVASFQAANGISATPPGFVGSLTRAKIQDISCNGASAGTNTTTPVSPVTPSIVILPTNQTSPAIQLLSPNGGETYRTTDDSIRVTYRTQNLTGQLTAYLYNSIVGNVRIIPFTIDGSGEFDLGIQKAGAERVGQYKIYLCKTMDTGKDLCASSANYFSLISSSTSQVTNYTPTINSLSSNQGKAGDTITIYGNNFLSKGAGMKVQLLSNNVILQTVDGTNMSTNQLQFIVPGISCAPGATCTYQVRVQNWNGVNSWVSSNTLNFTMSGAPVTVADTATSCTTQNTIMLGYDNGYIGCDIVANGTFDASKSYCEGQATKKRQTGLAPDVYGRYGYYWTTLTGLNKNEPVNVYINSNGNNIQCTPTLNAQSFQPVTPTPTLNVTVSPASGTVSAGQTGVTLGTFTFSNPSATPATVTGIELQRSGASNDASVGSITLYNGSTQLIGGGNFFANGIVWFLGSNVITIPAQSSVTITAKGNITGSANQTIIVGVAGVNASMPVMANFPVNSGTFTIANTSQTTPAPTISSLSPTSGPAGTVVTITGSNLNNSNVVFSAHESSLPNLNIVSPTSATFTVSSNWSSMASPTRIYVETMGVSGQSSAYFTVTQANTATSCTTQSTILVGGTIGCDIVANGTFDASKSYCEGQTTKKRQTGLSADVFGRANYYFATLTGLSNEPVNVYINSNGNNIQCTPSLNM